MTERIKQIASNTAAQLSLATTFHQRYMLVLNAVIKAVEGLEPEEVHNLCHNLEKTVPECEFKQRCEEYRKRLYGNI